MYTGTFTKTRNGGWAVRINNAFEEKPAAGSTVIVSTKKSVPEPITINDVFWHDPAQGVALANYDRQLLYGNAGWGQAQHLDLSDLGQ